MHMHVSQVWGSCFRARRTVGNFREGSVWGSPNCILVPKLFFNMSTKLFLKIMLHLHRQVTWCHMTPSFGSTCASNGYSQRYTVDETGSLLIWNNTIQCTGLETFFCFSEHPDYLYVCIADVSNTKSLTTATTIEFVLKWDKVKCRIWTY